MYLYNVHYMYSTCTCRYTVHVHVHVDIQYMYMYMYSTCTRTCTCRYTVHVHVHVDIQYMYMYMCIHEYHTGSGGCTLLPRETGGWSLTGAKGLSVVARNLVDLASLLEHIATLDGLELQIPCHSTVDQQLHKLTCTYHAYMHVQV